MFREGLFRCTGIGSVLTPSFQKRIDSILRAKAVVSLKTSAVRRFFEGDDPPVKVVHPQWKAKVEEFFLLCDLFETLVEEDDHAQGRGLSGNDQARKRGAGKKGRVP
jgi:hypothetical protein